MAADITASLRAIDPVDPVKFDFSICHLGMMNACGFGKKTGDASCPLKGACHPGRQGTRAGAIRKNIRMNRIISLGEVRLGLRLIVKQPILSITIILALATGICLATMGFTFREAMVNGQLPFQAGDRFARFNVLNREGGRIDLDLARYHAFRDRAATFRTRRRRRRPAVHARAPLRAKSNRSSGAFITPRSMALLEASPIAGRTLIPADGEPAPSRVVVDPRQLVAAALWRRSGADRPAARRSAASCAPSSASCPTRSSFPAPASCGCRSTS